MPLERYLRPTVTVTLDDTVVAAARKMRDRRVGCVIVIRGGRPIGILTDRDIAVRVVADERDPRTVRVADVVTYDPSFVSIDDSVETAAALMREHGVRRIPIVDVDGMVVGIVTADDLVVAIGESMAAVCEAIDGAADANETR